MGYPIGERIMGRIAKAKIEFTYDEDSIMEMMGEDAGPMTTEELVEYALDSFLEDIHTLVKYSEVTQAVDIVVV
jgi:hypothetical protein